jgi:hypothetical protein
MSDCLAKISSATGSSGLDCQPFPLLGLKKTWFSMMSMADYHKDDNQTMVSEHDLTVAWKEGRGRSEN